MHELKNYTVQIFKNFLKMMEFWANYSFTKKTSLQFCINIFFLFWLEFLDVKDFCLRNQHEYLEYT
jgi:hypothetical protein